MITRLWNWLRRKAEAREKKRELWSMIMRYRPARAAVVRHLISCHDDVSYVTVPTPGGRQVQLKATRLVRDGKRMVKAIDPKETQ